MLGRAREFRYDWILLRTRNLPHETGDRWLSRRPGWAGNNVGFYPFPTIADEMREEHQRRVLGE